MKREIRIPMSGLTACAVGGVCTYRTDPERQGRAEDLSIQGSLTCSLLAAGTGLRLWVLMNALNANASPAARAWVPAVAPEVIDKGRRTDGVRCTFGRQARFVAVLLDRSRDFTARRCALGDRRGECDRRLGLRDDPAGARATQLGRRERALASQDDWHCKSALDLNWIGSVPSPTSTRWRRSF